MTEITPFLPILPLSQANSLEAEDRCRPRFSIRSGPNLGSKRIAGTDSLTLARICAKSKFLCSMEVVPDGGRLVGCWDRIEVHAAEGPQRVDRAVSSPLSIISLGDVSAVMDGGDRSSYKRSLFVQQDSGGVEQYLTPSMGELQTSGQRHHASSPSPLL